MPMIIASFSAVSIAFWQKASILSSSTHYLTIRDKLTHCRIDLKSFTISDSSNFQISHNNEWLRPHFVSRDQFSTSSVTRWTTKTSTLATTTTDTWSMSTDIRRQVNAFYTHFPSMFILSLSHEPSVTRLGNFFKFLAKNCLTRVAQIFWWHFGLFSIMSLLCKKCVATFWTIYEWN